MAKFHVLWNHSKKDCSIRLMKRRNDIAVYKKNKFDSFNFSNKIFLQIGAKPVSIGDKNKEFVIIDMNWNDALRFSKKIPQEVEKRSILNFQTAYPKTNKRRIRPDDGLMSAECMFAAKLMAEGKADESLLDNYYFKKEFLEKNKKVIKKLMKNRN